MEEETVYWHEMEKKKLELEERCVLLAEENQKV